MRRLSHRRNAPRLPATSVYTVPMKQLTRTAVALAVLVIGATPASADLKLVQTMTGKGGMVSMNGTSTTYIKGLKMRTDTVTGDTTRSMVFDLDAQKMYMFDSKKKEADVWDMADFGKQIAVAADTSQMKASVKPTGQTKQVAGQNANGYEMSISMPTTIGDPKNGMAMTVTLAGPIWVVKGAPGTADYLRFYKAAAEKGWIFTDPNAAKRSPGQARAMAEMYNQLAATGGVPYETEMNIKMGGEGPMAAMMEKMGGMSSTTIVQSSDTATLAADLFAPPAGYKLNAKK
jgi:hypothetical protein